MTLCVACPRLLKPLTKPCKVYKNLTQTTLNTGSLAIWINMVCGDWLQRWIQYQIWVQKQNQLSTSALFHEYLFWFIFNHTWFFHCTLIIKPINRTGCTHEAVLQRTELILPHLCFHQQQLNVWTPDIVWTGWSVEIRSALVSHNPGNRVNV